MNKKNRKYYRDLGQVSHYLADYLHFHTTKYIREDLRITAPMRKDWNAIWDPISKAERLRGSIFPADILWMRKHSAIISRKRMMIILNETWCRRWYHAYCWGKSQGNWGNDRSSCEKERKSPSETLIIRENMASGVENGEKWHAVLIDFAWFRSNM